MGGRDGCLFEQVYLGFRFSLKSYFAAAVGPEEAEDLCQQLFLQLWAYLQSRPGFEPESWQAWLFRGAVNVKNDFLRRRASRPQTFPLLEGEGAAGEGPLAGEGPGLRRLALGRALASLSPEDRDLLLLRYMGFTSRETGEMLALSASGVRSRYAAAKRRFAQALKREELN